MTEAPAPLASTTESTPEPGICRFCFCTDQAACPGGCWWIDEDHTVCSSRACVDSYFAEKRVVVKSIFAAMQERM